MTNVIHFNYAMGVLSGGDISICLMKFFSFSSISYFGSFNFNVVVFSPDLMKAIKLECNILLKRPFLGYSMQRPFSLLKGKHSHCLRALKVKWKTYFPDMNFILAYNLFTHLFSPQTNTFLTYFTFVHFSCYNQVPFNFQVQNCQLS